MGKVKIKKKDTRIDMTAMSDVTVLLLTFFMLTSTFLQKEPVQVITPPSVSEEKVPDEKLTSVLISPDGKVYLALTGTKDATLKTEEFREEVLKAAVGAYNEGHSPKIALTEQDVETFKKLGTFGVPFKALKQWLALDLEKRDKALKEAGIPIKMSEEGTNNEFQIWLRAIYHVMHEKGVEEELVKKGTGIAIKADQTTPYNIVEVVMDNLQSVKLNKFSLMTALKAED